MNLVCTEVSKTKSDKTVYYYNCFVKSEQTNKLASGVITRVTFCKRGKLHNIFSTSYISQSGYN